jgi:hypothetical protein
VNFDGVLAVFQLVHLFDGLGRQFPRFANRNEAGTNLLRDGGAEDEAAAFDADDRIDARAGVRLAQRLDRCFEPRGLLEQRRDVEEVDARFGKSGTLRIICFRSIVNISVLMPKPVRFRSDPRQ